MKFIVVVILLVLTACTLFLALKNHICTRAEKLLTSYIQQFKKYESLLKADYINLSIRVNELFPYHFKNNADIAKCSADLRKYFILAGYKVENYSEDLVDWSFISPNLYKEFSNYFRGLKLISFNNGEPFREEDF